MRCVYIYLTAILGLNITVPSSVATPKKGVGLPGSTYRCGDTYALNDTSWWYNWYYDFGRNEQLHCSRPTRGVQIPMIWGEDNIKHAKIHPDAKYVLGFNEPNEPHQSNITPERAAELWPQVEQKARGKILVGPALAGCDIFPGKCIDWFDRFFKACKHCRVDRIAVHGYHCVPHKLMESLGMISSHYNRRIWLTEFSCKGNVTVEEDMKFMKQIVPLLERASFVERYAWFCARKVVPTAFLPNLSTSLLEQNAPVLSRLGKLYNELK